MEEIHSSFNFLSALCQFADDFPLICAAITRLSETDGVCSVVGITGTVVCMNSLRTSAINVQKLTVVSRLPGAGHLNSVQ